MKHPSQPKLFPTRHEREVASFRKFRSVETHSCAEISGLVVDRSIRSCGIRRKLLHAAEKWVRSIGCDAISVKCNVIRDRAQA